MKHRLAPLLEGMEMGKSEHDWLEQRLESMTAKEELLFRGAMQIESPRDIQTTIQILQGLDHYQLLYGAEDDVLLGRFVMEHIHTPTHAARGYLDPEIVGAAYREHGSGSFVENHYVERLNPDRPLPEVNPNMPLPNTGEYAIRIKLVSRNNMEGVWIGFPDTGEYMDAVHPDELLLGLDALQAETLDQCMAVDVDCALPRLPTSSTNMTPQENWFATPLTSAMSGRNRGRENPTGWKMDVCHGVGRLSPPGFGTGSRPKPPLLRIYSPRG